MPHKFPGVRTRTKAAQYTSLANEGDTTEPAPAKQSEKVTISDLKRAESALVEQRKMAKTPVELRACVDAYSELEKSVQDKYKRRPSTVSALKDTIFRHGTTAKRTDFLADQATRIAKAKWDVVRDMFQMHIANAMELVEFTERAVNSYKNLGVVHAADQCLFSLQEFDRDTDRLLGEMRKFVDAVSAAKVANDGRILQFNRKQVRPEDVLGLNTLAQQMLDPAVPKIDGHNAYVAGLKSKAARDRGALSEPIMAALRIAELPEEMARIGEILTTEFTRTAAGSRNIDGKAFTEVKRIIQSSDAIPEHLRNSLSTAVDVAAMKVANEAVLKCQAKSLYSVLATLKKGDAALPIRAMDEAWTRAASLLHERTGHPLIETTAMAQIIQTAKHVLSADPPLHFESDAERDAVHAQLRVIASWDAAIEHRIAELGGDKEFKEYESMLGKALASREDLIVAMGKPPSAAHL